MIIVIITHCTIATTTSNSIIGTNTALVVLVVMATVSSVVDGCDIAGSVRHDEPAIVAVMVTITSVFALVMVVVGLVA